MSRARLEIINEENKVRNFEDLDSGTVFEYEGHLYLKTDAEFSAVLLSDNALLGHLIDFYSDDSVIVYDKTVITVRT